METQKKTPRTLVLESGNYTPLPNLLFDEVMEGLPAECFCVLVYVYRQTVGFNRWYFEKNLEAICLATHIKSREQLSRWLHVFNRTGWFQYTPAQNGVKVSRIRFVRLPTVDEARNFAISLDEAMDKERDWARENVREVFPDEETDYSYRTRPRCTAKIFADLFEREFKKPCR